MKDNHTANSRNITYTFLFKSLGEYTSWTYTFLLPTLIFRKDTLRFIRSWRFWQQIQSGQLAPARWLHRRIFISSKKEFDPGRRRYVLCVRGSKRTFTHKHGCSAGWRFSTFGLLRRRLTLFDETFLHRKRKSQEIPRDFRASSKLFGLRIFIWKRNGMAGL